MVTSSSDDENDDRTTDLQAFDDTKAGVKGLVDAKIAKIPKIFYSPPDPFAKIPDSEHKESSFSIPVVDLNEIVRDQIGHRAVVDKIRGASETWGFFQVVNHGIPVDVLDKMLEGVRRFYEQDDDVKKTWYTRDGSKTVVYNSNFDLFRAASANWRDTTYVNMAPRPPAADDLPQACRDILIKYSKEIMNLGRSLFKLLSEALGIDEDHLNNIGCSEGLAVLSHYYPPCPEPELTLGASKHADYDFMTVLLQDQIGGLQVLCDDQWVDIPPVPGALVVNIGDLLQLISNDKFKSSQHRVLANRHSSPRVSVACFFTTGLAPSPKLYGPIKELLSEEHPSRYRETTVRDYSLHYNAKGLGTTSALLDFRL